jgi:hypothetical protein
MICQFLISVLSFPFALGYLNRKIHTNFKFLEVSEDNKFIILIFLGHFLLDYLLFHFLSLQIQVSPVVGDVSLGNSNLHVR